MPGDQRELSRQLHRVSAALPPQAQPPRPQPRLHRHQPRPEAEQQHGGQAQAGDIL